VTIERRQVLFLMAGAPGAVLAGIDPAGATDAHMEKVLGIGGFFFRATDPSSLSRWYREHLGIALTPVDYDTLPWHTEAGPTVFAPFPRDTAYFGADAQNWMVNFRVRNLDKIAAQLRSKGIAVDTDPKTYPNGRFARLHDPEGNPIELWQPAGRGVTP
jgi:glyoxylase I family protein